jgi:hypothetical protein
VVDEAGSPSKSMMPIAQRGSRSIRPGKESSVASSHTRLHSNGPILAQKGLKSRVALDLRYTVGNAGYSVGHAAGAILVR